MPQMSLLWLILFCYTIILLIILITVLYFFFLPKSPSNMSFSLMNNSLNNKNVKIWIWWR